MYRRTMCVLVILMMVFGPMSQTLLAQGASATPAAESGKDGWVTYDVQKAPKGSCFVGKIVYQRKAADFHCEYVKCRGCVSGNYTFRVRNGYHMEPVATVVRRCFHRSTLCYSFVEVKGAVASGTTIKCDLNGDCKNDTTVKITVKPANCHWERVKYKQCQRVRCHRTCIVKCCDEELVADGCRLNLTQCVKRGCFGRCYYYYCFTSVKEKKAAKEAVKEDDDVTSSVLTDQ